MRQFVMIEAVGANGVLGALQLQGCAGDESKQGGAFGAEGAIAVDTRGEIGIGNKGNCAAMAAAAIVHSPVLRHECSWLDLG